MAFDLRREMRAYGLQRDLAKSMGVSIAYISAIYTGKKPAPDQLLEILGWEREVTKKETYRRKKEKAE
jgi:transcriptional regulator with XRE-family HTH domain